MNYLFNKIKPCHFFFGSDQYVTIRSKLSRFFDGKRRLSHQKKIAVGQLSTRIISVKAWLPICLRLSPCPQSCSPYFFCVITALIKQQLYNQGSLRALQVSMYFEVKISKVSRGKSFSEALILTSTNPQYDKRLFIESQVQ